MKFKEPENDSMDLAENPENGKEEISIFDDIKFWDRIEKMFYYGTPAKNKHDHGVDVRYKVREIDLDASQRLRQICPDNWFKSQASLNRSVWAVGKLVLMEFLKKNQKNQSELSELHQIYKIHMNLHKISRVDRLQELDEEIEDLEYKISFGSTDNPEKQKKTIDILSKARKRIRKL